MALRHSPFFTCLSYRIKKRKKGNDFRINQITQTYTKTWLLLQKTGFLLGHYRLDKSIEAENMPPNNPDLNLADYSILENLSQRLYKHQRIRGMQHLKDLLEEKREELPQYEIDACINQFRYRLLNVVEVAGKQIVNIFF